MSRELDPILLGEINKAALQPVILCEFLFDGGDVRFWNGIGDITFDSRTFTGAGNLLGISEYEETEKLEALGLTFTLNGINSSILSVALQEPYQGRVCNLYFGAITLPEEFYLRDESGAVITGEDGLPLYLESFGELAPPYLQFSGLMDVMRITEAGGTCNVSVTAESKMIILTRSKERRYTDEEQKTEYPSDLGFQFVTQIQDREVVWGGAQ